MEDDFDMMEEDLFMMEDDHLSCSFHHFQPIQNIKLIQTALVNIEE